MDGPRRGTVGLGPPPMRPTLLLALLIPLTSIAGDFQSMVSDEARPHRRNLILRLSDLNDQATPAGEVFVAGGQSTIITTPWAISARGTGVGGRGERPFELLLGKQRLVLTPTRPLLPGERFPLVLRLRDDTVVPLVLVAAPPGRGPDGQVALAFDDDEQAELRLQLAVATARVDGLASRLRQALQEQDSEDFALAQLLAAGQAPLTSLQLIRERQVGSDEPGRISITTYAAPESGRHEPRKVGLVVTYTNTDSGPASIAAKDVYNEGTLARAQFAARGPAEEIAPGATGRVSVVLDAASLGADGGALRLDLQVIRGGAAALVSADLRAKDFGLTSWWP